MISADPHPSLVCSNSPSRPCYFGAPGALIEIEWPRKGVSGARTPRVEEFVLGAGDVRVDRQLLTKRRYTLGWEALVYSDWVTIWAYEQGHNGLGPWAFLDPNIVNLLTANQSSTTSQMYDITGFTVTGTGGSIASSATVVKRGPRSLAWAFSTISPGTSTLTLDPPSTMWYGVPVHIGDPYVFSAQLRGSGSDPILDVTPQMLWYTSTGGLISTSSGTPVTTGAGAWSQAYVTDTAPATAAFTLCRLSTSSATVSGGSMLNVDELQLEVGSTPSTWRPGVGVFPVEIISLTPDHHMFRTGMPRVNSPTLTLREVGP